nr:LysR substrate-binding domain-containing protein [uncultured Sphingomonas sp.]
MTLEQLRIFLAVAEELNMTRAAGRLNLTQPAVSAAISTLEERHNTRLFDRVGRHIELTEAGRLLLPEAAAVLARAETARQILDDLAGLARGTLRIAASQTVANYWLPARMAAFADTAPAIQQSLIVGNSEDAARHLRDGGADLAFIESEIDDSLLATRVVGDDRIAIYAAPNHRLHGHGDAVDALRSATWVMREKGSGTRGHLENGLRRLGIDPATIHVALELPSNGAVLAAVENSRLIGAVSQLAARARLDAGQVKQLFRPFPRRDFTMLRHRSRRLSRAAEAFVKMLDP